MVVDIQGVNDIWTDPQVRDFWKSFQICSKLFEKQLQEMRDKIHTVSGDDYGDGNLGLRGMTLFFLSHQCNPICDYLKLPKFELHLSEKQNILQEESVGLSKKFALIGTIAFVGAFLEKILQVLSIFCQVLTNCQCWHFS